MMDFLCQKMTLEEVLCLLNKAENSFTPPLSHNIPYTVEEYAKRLSSNAIFIICKENDEIIGFIAYYVNIEGQFVYITQIWVSDHHQRKGIGSIMLEQLIKKVPTVVDKVQLEVRMNNEKASSFYRKVGFLPIREENNRYLMEKRIRTKNRDE